MKAKLLSIAFLSILLASCIKQKDTEDEKPKIEFMSPLPCDTLYFGGSFHITMRITDDSGLGNISMDMHNNFGQHNHGDHESCAMDDAKDAVNPFANSWIFALPSERTDFIFDTIIPLPERKNDSVFYDKGDYHFHIYITDNDGYQVFTSLDTKVLGN